MQSISVRHNIEVAHRLFEAKGKCEAIHGHSMWVTMAIAGRVDDKGMLLGLDFGDVKREFRKYLDETYDHHLLLNEDDPWAQQLHAPIEEGKQLLNGHLPGLVKVVGDPTTENIAKWIGERFTYVFGTLEGFEGLGVEVQETHVNSAHWVSEKHHVFTWDKA